MVWPLAKREPEKSADDSITRSLTALKIAALRNAVEALLKHGGEWKIADSDKRHHLCCEVCRRSCSESIATPENETYRASNGNTRHYTQRITALSEVNETNKDAGHRCARAASPKGCTAADSALLSFSGKNPRGLHADDEARKEAQKASSSLPTESQTTQWL
ncbi:MAG: hypothetical protein ACLVKA_04270 [Collinsella aerofaciens]